MPMTLSGTTGIVQPSAAAPAFCATQSGAQTFGSGTWTKLTFATETFDTNSNFDTAASRFTPTVAGYYQINLTMSANESGAGGVVLRSAIYKNGSAITDIPTRDDNGQPRNLSQSTLVYLNGTSDYIEAYGYTSGGTFSNSTRTLSGSFVRSA